MILKRLFELAEREGLLDDPAFESLPVPLIVKIGPQGEYLGIEERRGTISMPSRNKDAPPRTKPNKGIPIRAPKAHGNTANKGFARYFVDTLPRVLPVSDDPKARSSRATFWEQVNRAAEETDDPALRAMQVFGRQMANDTALIAKVQSNLEPLKPAAGDRCTFAWHSDAGSLIVDREPVRNWYRAFFAVVSTELQDAGSQGLCQITGQFGPLPRSHSTRIGGVPDGLASGVSLVSYDKAAFESYGLDGAVNSGVGFRAADGYTRALNALIGNKLTGRPRTSLRLGGDIFLFWARLPTDQSDLMQLDRPEADQVARLLESAQKGREVHAAEPNDFYCLCLSANGARAIVRDYLELPIPQARANLSRWFRDLEIVDHFTLERTAIFPLWMLANATVRQGDELPPNLPVTLLRAALKGTLVSERVLGACLGRTRVETGSSQFSPARIALIKLILNRLISNGGRKMAPLLDEGRTDDGAYVCGRLFACLAYIQAFERNPRKHGYGQEAAMMSSYYGTASAAPQSVFGTLLRHTQFRLNKLRDQYAGFVTNRSKELEDLMAHLTQFPAILSLVEQGRFAIGLYHQRSAYRAAKVDATPENK